MHAVPPFSYCSAETGGRLTWQPSVIKCQDVQAQQQLHCLLVPPRRLLRCRLPARVLMPFVDGLPVHEHCSAERGCQTVLVHLCLIWLTIALLPAVMRTQPQRILVAQAQSCCHDFCRLVPAAC